MAHRATLTDAYLPAFFSDADAASLRGQRLTLRLSALRLAGALVAALGGAIGTVQTAEPDPGGVSVWAVLVVLGFAVALVAEVVLFVEQPERDWYAGRALAESAKTLAWRYAVVADPFGPEVSTEEARELMRSRLQDVASKGADRVVISSGRPLVTGAMEACRAATFEERRRVYVTERTEAQHRWYVVQADQNRRHALSYRVGLIAGEVVALVLAVVMVFHRWPVDASGVLAACVASGAAWMGLKQFGPLASAYTTTARELALQADRLGHAEEADWSRAVADAEEAISREYTMWLASRSASGLP